MVMVRPFLTSLNAIVANPASAARSLPPHAALISPHHLMHYHDASRARRCKGKEKALPDSDWLECAEWLLSSNCRSRLFVPYPVPPRQALHTLHAPARPTPAAPRAPGTPRTFSTASSHAVVPQAPPADPQAVIASFMRDHDDTAHREPDGPPVSADDAWAAFRALQDAHAAPPPHARWCLDFADRVATAVEDTLDDAGALCAWAARLRGLLGAADWHGYQRGCLLVRAAAMAGELDEAAAGMRRVKRARQPWRNMPAVMARAVRGVVLAVNRVRGREAVLDWLVEEWVGVGKDIARTVDSARNLQEVVDAVFAILDTNPAPAAQLMDAYRGKSMEYRTRVGHIFITWLLAREAPEDAFAVMENMDAQNIEVNQSIRFAVLRALTHWRADVLATAGLKRAEWHITPDHFKQRSVISARMQLLARQSDTSRVQAVFDEAEAQGLSGRDQVATLMHAYAMQADTANVIRIFDKYFPANGPSLLGYEISIYHYSEVILAHARAGDWDGVHEWFTKMREASFEPDAHVYHIIFQGYADHGQFDKALMVLEAMRNAGFELGVVVYTSLISYFGDRRDAVSAEAVYKRAVQEGVKPNRWMISALMHAHAQAGSWRGVIHVYDYMMASKERQLRPRIDVYNILLKAYVRLGAPFSVVNDLFGRIERGGITPSPRTYCLLIQSACEAGTMDIANRILKHMESRELALESNLFITVHALTLIMMGYLRAGMRTAAKQVYDEMVARGIRPTSVTFGAIIQAYCRERDEQSMLAAQDFLKSLMEKSPRRRNWLARKRVGIHGLDHLYGPLLGRFVRTQPPEAVERLVDEMQEHGGEMTLRTWSALLKMYCHAGELEPAREVWARITELVFRAPEVDELLGPGGGDAAAEHMRQRDQMLWHPLSVYMDALSAGGCHDEVAALWGALRARGFAFDIYNWNQLVVALVRAGEPVRAYEVVEKVIIPSQALEQALESARPAAGASPLVFEDAPAEDAAKAAPGALVYPVYRGKRHAPAAHGPPAPDVDAAWFDFDADAARPDDRARPLHMLAQTAPRWAAWRPFGSTLRVLGRVLVRLRAGRLVRRVLREDEAAPPDDTDAGEWEAAEALFARVCAECPRAVEAVEEFRRVEMARGERARVQSAGAGGGGMG